MPFCTFFLIVFSLDSVRCFKAPSLDSVRCFKAPSVLQRQLEERFAMIMSMDVCVLGFHFITGMYVTECVSNFHRDTLDGHSKGQCLLCEALDDPTSKNTAYLYSSGC